MNRAEIARLRQSLFRQEMEEIRRRVRDEKALASRRCEPQEPPRVRRRTKAAMRTKRRSRFISDSLYASALQNWWASQERFTRKSELANFLGVDPETVSSWTNSKKFPQDKMCDTLFSLTGLECFSPQQRTRARCEHFLNRAKKGLRGSKNDDGATHRTNGHVVPNFQVDD
jgi:hypothetical protein